MSLSQIFSSAQCLQRLQRPMLAQSSNVPFAPNRNVPSGWLRALAVGHSFVDSPGRWPATKGPGESERSRQHEPARIEPSGSDAAVESQTDQPAASGGTLGSDGAPGQAPVARLSHGRGQGADLQAARPAEQPPTRPQDQEKSSRNDPRALRRFWANARPRKVDGSASPQAV